MFGAKVITTISVDISLPAVEFGPSTNTFTFTYVLKRNIFGWPSCKCNKKYVEYGRSDNPSGPGSYWQKCRYRNLIVYQRYIWPGLNGDRNALIRYYQERNGDVPEEVQKDAGRWLK